MSTGKVYQVWSSEMVQCLLSKIRLLWPNFHDGKYTMKTLYEDASSHMCKSGFPMTPYRVEKKWHNLVTTYRNILGKKNNNATTATLGDDPLVAARKHDYFEELHEIMGNMKTVRAKPNHNTQQQQQQPPLSPPPPPTTPPSPEPRRKRLKVEDVRLQTPQIILVR
ncbi:hypothetical protein Pcinc_030992 [Petrolisthes cinctipes]|uniref:Myb/SANT-like DNA-binding domain-containing protein n=1 Tax=Petrolisthes cinctipes TaxID=88211 RepID=A0AAE1EX93_PETCI|nr:hypothetical protein Pcinc_030992 [Petrolisthes cinctipes]